MAMNYNRNDNMPFEKFLHNSLFNYNGNFVKEAIMIRCRHDFQTVIMDLNLTTCDGLKERVEHVVRNIIPNVDSINYGRLMTILALIQHILVNCLFNHENCNYQNTIKELANACKYLNTLLIPANSITLCNFIRYVDKI